MRRARRVYGLPNEGPAKLMMGRVNREPIPGELSCQTGDCCG